MAKKKIAKKLGVKRKTKTTKTAAARTGRVTKKKAALKKD